MSNLFDGYQNGVFDRVTNVMGRDAVWLPSAGGPEQTGRVLLNTPTEKEMIGNAEYTPVTRKMEYRSGVFTGLFERVKASYTETVTIDGQDYVCYAGGAMFDGKTYILRIEPTS